MGEIPIVKPLHISELERQFQEAMQEFEQEEYIEPVHCCGEDDVREEVMMKLRELPQEIMLNQTQTREFLKSEELFKLNKVPLRQRRLAAGETVILVTFDKEFHTTVISAERCVPEDHKYGFTNLVLQK